MCISQSLEKNIAEFGGIPGRLVSSEVNKIKQLIYMMDSKHVVSITLRGSPGRKQALEERRVIYLWAINPQ